MRFFRSCVAESTSTTKLSSDCRGRSLVSTTNPVSRIVKLICLFFVREKRIYAPVKRKRIIAPKRLTNHSDSQMTAASTTANPINQTRLLSKCSPL